MAGKGGGAWKVAYADFVTAMMAFFMVMWITAQNEKVTTAVAHYFHAPYESIVKSPPNMVSRETMGSIPSKGDKSSEESPFSQSGKFQSPSVVEVEMLRQLNQSLMKALQQQSDDAEGNSVKLELTGSGLNITVYDRASKQIFEPNSSAFTDYGRWVFSTLAWEIARYTAFNIELEGHTDREPEVIPESYDKWQLSVDRANSARRVLVEFGVRDFRMRKVSGYGDTKPLDDSVGGSPINGRVGVQLVVITPDNPYALKDK